MVDRANYGRLYPLIGELKKRDDVQLQVVAGGTMVLHRFGMPVDVVRREGTEVDAEVYMELEGSTPLTMAKSVGLGAIEFASEFQRLKPDVVVVIGDRYEAFSAAIAAAFTNTCLVHIQGGEVSGSIDESTRHAITKLAHFHMPATHRAAEYIIRMGEKRETILTVGCPSSDTARVLDRTLPAGILNKSGSGAEIDPSKPFLLALFHPVTTEFGGEGPQIKAMLEALHEMAMPTVLLWPNIDAGSNTVSKEIRRFRDQTGASWLRLVTNWEPSEYARVLANAACAVGNSSSFVRDAGYYGTPVVLVGNRQEGREWDEHVWPTEPAKEAILKNIEGQLAKGRRPASTLYGDGYVAPRMAAALAELKPYDQKRLSYIYEQS